MRNKHIKELLTNNIQEKKKNLRVKNTHGIDVSQSMIL